ncbi:unnamed protein product, partial [Rotaria sp. Silwood2]
MENAKIYTTLNNNRQQLSPHPFPVRKSIPTSRRKTLALGALATSDACGTLLTASKSIELSRPKGTEAVAVMNNVLLSGILEEVQSSDLQEAKVEVDGDEFLDAEDNVIPRNNSDEQSTLLRNISNFSSKKQVRRAVREIGIATQEDAVNFSAFNLSELIKASKRTQNKEIRKELENRCR